jgi:hypothetical protein
MFVSYPITVAPPQTKTRGLHQMEEEISKILFAVSEDCGLKGMNETLYGCRTTSRFR